MRNDSPGIGISNAFCVSRVFSSLIRGIVEGRFGGVGFHARDASTKGNSNIKSPSPQPSPPLAEPDRGVVGARGAL